MRDVQMRDFGITRLEWAEPRDVSRGPTAGPWSVGLTSGPAIGRSSLPTAPSSPSYVVLAELTERVRARSRSDLRGQVCAYAHRLTAPGITEFLAANALNRAHTWCACSCASVRGLPKRRLNASSPAAWTSTRSRRRSELVRLAPANL